MPTGHKSLHAQNALWIAAYVTLHIVAFISLATAGTIDLVSIKAQISEVLSGKGALAAMAFIASIVLNGLLSSNTKASLVFWRFRYPLPGHRAFTHLGPRDPRVDMAALKTALGPLFTTPNGQNVAWFNLYRRFQNEPSVAEAHRRYLLTRDLAALTLMFLVLLPPALYICRVRREHRRWVWFLAILGLCVDLLCRAALWSRPRN